MIFNRNKLKEFFNKDSSKMNKQLQNESNRNIVITYDIIDNTESAYLCSMAARTCYGLEPENTYDKCLAHIKRVMGYGHDSICGHSNIMVLLCFKSNNTVLSDFDLSSIYTSLSALHFMNIVPLDFIHNKDAKEYFVLMSGSIRAFRYFIQIVLSQIVSYLRMKLILTLTCIELFWILLNIVSKKSSLKI